MPNDIGQLRRLAKEFKITFDSAADGEPWPKAHQKTFNDIVHLGKLSMEEYSNNSSSSGEPWRQRTKDLANWLAKRTRQLCKQQRNEAGWRHAIENGVLGRFNIEVACPHCRARIWRSEIEAALNQEDSFAEELEKRRSNRKPCQCPQYTRPTDINEIGTNVLFDDRAEEFMIHDDAVGLKLPKQKPDRIYGIQETRNFREILSRTVCSQPADSMATKVGDLVRTSPFKFETKPLLFPFLLLETKSESSSNGFDDAETQSALPLRTLLKLQQDLLSLCRLQAIAFEPLVWFFASRGDVWRVYGGYSGYQTDGVFYNFAELWEGSLKRDEKALQLLLIVDYILDWARDVYRPCILRLLKSTSTSKTFEEVSLFEDDDIISMRRNIESWIPTPPSTWGEQSVNDELPEDSSTNIRPESVLPFRIPNTSLGSVRSALLTDFRFSCLYITSDNLEELLEADFQRRRTTKYEYSVSHLKPPRDLFFFLKKWDEYLMLSEQQLVNIELWWTGRSSFDCSEEVTGNDDYYVLLEASTYVDLSWNIIKELSCLAISTKAFDRLVFLCEFGKRPPEADHILEIVRSCDDGVLLPCFQCLRAGSPTQVLLSATASSLISLYPVPERKRADFAPRVEAVAFGHIEAPRVKRFISQHQILGLQISDGQKKPKQRAPHQSNRPRINQPTFRRVSSRRVKNPLESPHDSKTCERCHLAKPEAGVFQRDIATDKSSGHRAALVVSMREPVSDAIRSSTIFDVCLFCFEMSNDLTGGETVPVLVEDLLQPRFLYHTVQRSPQSVVMTSQFHEYRHLLWNYPSPYRSCTDSEWLAAYSWLAELQGKEIPKRPNDWTYGDHWNHLQVAICALRSGKTDNEARETADNFLQSDRIRQQTRPSWERDGSRRAMEKVCCELLGVNKFPPISSRFPPATFKLKGDEVKASRYTTAVPSKRRFLSN